MEMQGLTGCTIAGKISVRRAKLRYSQALTLAGKSAGLSRKKAWKEKRVGATRQVLFDRLAELGIETRTVEHAAVFTVAESERLEAEIPGGHTKNLFLKDAKGKLFLVIAESQTQVDLKSLHHKLDCKRLSFGKANLLEETLGVTPGSVTAFAVINDTRGLVDVVLDQRLMQFQSVNCHPLENTATTNIALEDLLRFIEASDHTFRTVDLGSGTN